ncbi:MAG: heme NO-binding domain-containing protein [Puniceicoccales bacterium]
MKGIVFAEFLDMVEEKYGLAIVNRITAQDGLATGGAYSNVGNYPHEEMLILIDGLLQEVEVSRLELIRAFGNRLFQVFLSGHESFFVGATDPLDFLSGVETVIHADVRKLYPDAVLPDFDCFWMSDNVLVMDYSSPRPLADLAQALIEVSIQHFGVEVKIQRLDGPTEDAHSARFILTRVP